MITYHTNWMGPINNDWIANNGGYWACGRIDVYGLSPDEYYDGKTEIGLPLMYKEDWYEFSEWVQTVTTNKLYSLNDLVSLYYKAGHNRIRWFDKENIEVAHAR